MGCGLVEKNCGLPRSGAGASSNSAMRSRYEGFDAIQFGPFASKRPLADGALNLFRSPWSWAYIRQLPISCRATKARH